MQKNLHHNLSYLKPYSKRTNLYIIPKEENVKNFQELCMHHKEQNVMPAVFVPVTILW